MRLKGLIKGSQTAQRINKEGGVYLSIDYYADLNDLVAPEWAVKLITVEEKV